MPNFHTHWLVALQAIDGLPLDYLRDGRDNYVAKATAFGLALRNDLKAVLERVDMAAAASFQKTVRTRLQKWETDMRSDDDAKCFSAFLLGACGPDFWMLPAEASSMIPDMAAHHFDLGHYNRTHCQFEVSIAALGKRDDLQARVEKSYFLGMATHIGADLIIHQLVNVYAGAYNLLKFGKLPPGGTWSNEQGYELLAKHTGALWKDLAAKQGGDALPVWTTHNKVEHYWDTWVRYRWLGDYGQVWQDEPPPTFQVMGLPLVDTLRRDVLGKTEGGRGLWNSAGNTAGGAAQGIARGFWNVLPGKHDAKVREKDLEATITQLDNVLNDSETRWLLEKPLNFPWLFCDSVLAGSLKPFIYSRVVNKAKGAYPRSLVYQKAKDEARHVQMEEPSASAKKAGASSERSEKRKLLFFSSERNQAIAPTSWNYLNYLICPNLQRLQKFGADIFFDRSAFRPFLDSAADLAKTFAMGLANAYSRGSPKQLGKLGQFWNLDTGHGFQVQSVVPQDRHQVVTRIDLIHALGPAGIGKPIRYEQQRPPAYTKKMKVCAEEPYPLSQWTDDKRAFTTYEPKEPFQRLSAVAEDPSVLGGPRYLSALKLENPLIARVSTLQQRLRKAKDDADFEKMLFEDVPKPSFSALENARTAEVTKIALPLVDFRLDLVLRAPIAHLGAQAGEVAGYLLGDKDDQLVEEAASEDRNSDKDNEMATVWLRKQSKLLDKVTVSHPDTASANAGLASFSTRLIVNLNDRKRTDRVVHPAGKWNNVIPYDKHQGHYGRNFGLATARKHVLRGSVVVNTNFDPTGDYKYLDKLGLTEHVFFTIYPLVKTPAGWIDAFSKKPVSSPEEFAKLKKVDAINFVKIILLYDAMDGATQLGWAYLDGIRVQVRQVPE